MEPLYPFKIKRNKNNVFPLTTKPPSKSLFIPVSRIIYNKILFSTSFSHWIVETLKSKTNYFMDLNLRYEWPVWIIFLGSFFSCLMIQKLTIILQTISSINNLFTLLYRNRYPWQTRNLFFFCFIFCSSLLSHYFEKLFNSLQHFSPFSFYNVVLIWRDVYADYVFGGTKIFVFQFIWMWMATTKIEMIRFLF